MISDLEIIFISFAAISASFSFTILLTGLLWPNVLLSKSRPFSTTVFFISLSDFCVSIMNCLGFPLNGTLQCSIQAFGLFYFPCASWLWTVMLVFQLKTLIISKHLQISMSWIHVICWVVPLVLSLLPLSTNQYGTDDYGNGNLTCDLWGNTTTKFIWLDLSSSGAALVCIILMAIWTFKIYAHFRLATDSAREMSFLNIMRLYPLALLFTWLPRCLSFFLISVDILQLNAHSAYLAGYFFILSTQYGTLTSLIYFTQSPASRMLWVNLLRRIFFQHFGMSLRDASEVTFPFPEESSDVANSIEDVLVVRAMIDGENLSLRERLSSSYPTSRDESFTAYIRESETSNTIVQVADRRSQVA